MAPGAAGPYNKALQLSKRGGGTRPCWSIVIDVRFAAERPCSADRTNGGQTDLSGQTAHCCSRPVNRLAIQRGDCSLPIVHADCWRRVTSAAEMHAPRGRRIMIRLSIAIRGPWARAWFRLSPRSPQAILPCTPSNTTPGVLLGLALQRGDGGCRIKQPQQATNDEQSLERRVGCPGARALLSCWPCGGATRARSFRNLLEPRCGRTRS